ncbi:hypothetical protein PoB_002213300 [Plakobranchus ocellatus]|uniref:Uncharacterized protein n=1 Tax=Plakobranchus ocellatus TaxID=259542 RepID=A0AAV3ZLB9_9GAST|nr:hypothetical protein PoB_002213300 [Plakobranchus ocellatus]
MAKDTFQEKHTYKENLCMHAQNKAQQDDLKLSGAPSSQGVGGGTLTWEIMVLEDHMGGSYLICHQCPLLMLKVWNLSSTPPKRLGRKKSLSDIK